MSSGRTITLNTGDKISALGYGTWSSGPGDISAGVYEALKVGYRHIDTAKIYGNHRQVGEGIKRALAEVDGLKREDIFVTTKLWNDSHQPDLVPVGLDDALQELGLDYVDVADANGVIPLDRQTSITQTWRAMTELPKSKVKAIGVSNFAIEHLEAIIKATGITPAVNQIERHPRLLDEPLVKYAADKHIVLAAYSALGNNHASVPLLVEHDQVKAVAARLTEAKGRAITPAHVLFAWAQVGGHAVISKSLTPSRIRDNFEEVVLDQEDIDRLNKIGQTDRRRFYIPCTYTVPWNVNVFGEDCEKKVPKVIL